ncbi:MAG TPA: terminase small subunit [Candidatus Angelobacter sp.]
MFRSIRRDPIEEETKLKPDGTTDNLQLSCLTEKQLRFVSAWTGNLVAAARTAGYSNPKAAAYKLMRDPYIVQALQKKQDSMLQESGEHLARTLPLSRADVIDRLWQLAQLAPERTNCNITGQVKASQALEQIFALNLDRDQRLRGRLEGTAKADAEFYVIHGFLPHQDKQEPVLLAPAEAPQLPESTTGNGSPDPEPARALAEPKPQ